MLIDLTVRNLKGLSGDYKFTDRTIITGDNGVGKTALLQAVMLDLFGHIPELGVQPSSTRKLASAEVMMVNSKHDLWQGFQKWSKKYESRFIPDDHVHSPVELVTLTAFENLTGINQSRFLLRKTGVVVDPDEIYKGLLKELAGHAYSEEEIKLVDRFSPDRMFAAEGTKNDWIYSVVDAAKSRQKNLSYEIKGARAATSEIVDQTTGGDSTETVTDLQPEIDRVVIDRENLHMEVNEQQGLFTLASVTADATKDLGVRLKREVEALQLKQTETPKCNRCESPVECPICAKNPRVENDDIAKKQTELAELRLRHKQQLKDRDALAEVLKLTQDKDQPLKLRQDELLQKQALWHQAQGKRLAAGQAGGKVEVKERELEIISRFVGLAAGAIERLLTTSMTKLLEVANKLVLPVVGLEMTYKDEAFGYLRDGKFVEFATLSGSEKQVATAAIGLALCSETPEKILLLDELGVMRSSTKKRLIDTVGQLVKDRVIHQFIATTPSITPREAEYYNAEGVTIITIERP